MDVTVKSPCANSHCVFRCGREERFCLDGVFSIMCQCVSIMAALISSIDRNIALIRGSEVFLSMEDTPDDSHRCAR